MRSFLGAAAAEVIGLALKVRIKALEAQLQRSSTQQDKGVQNCYARLKGKAVPIPCENTLSRRFQVAAEHEKLLPKSEQMSIQVLTMIPKTFGWLKPGYEQPGNTPPSPSLGPRAKSQQDNQRSQLLLCKFPAHQLLRCDPRQEKSTCCNNLIQMTWLMTIDSNDG